MAHPQIYKRLDDYTKIIHKAVPPTLLGRVLGLDVGSKWIGVALSDTRQVIASPHSLYERKSFLKDRSHMDHLIRDYDIKVIIVGMPLNLDGTQSNQGQDIEHYIHRLSEEAPFPIPVAFWDERFSTSAVERAMLSHDMTRKKREKRIDKLAATYMLQGALDYMGRTMPPITASLL